MLLSPELPRQCGSILEEADRAVLAENPDISSIRHSGAAGIHFPLGQAKPSKVDSGLRRK